MQNNTQEVTPDTGPAIQTNDPAQIAQLQLSDILTAAQIISLASTRGAFRAEEFTQVGGCFDRITLFLKESGALNQAPATGSEQAADTSPAE